MNFDNMNYYKKGWLEFYPSKLWDELKDVKPYIVVVSHKLNKRVYKKRGWAVGRILFHPKVNRPMYQQSEESCIGYDSMLMISQFLLKLESGSIQCDWEEGCFNEIH